MHTYRITEPNGLTVYWHVDRGGVVVVHQKHGIWTSQLADRKDCAITLDMVRKNPGTFKLERVGW